MTQFPVFGSTCSLTLLIIFTHKVVSLLISVLFCGWQVWFTKCFHSHISKKIRMKQSYCFTCPQQWHFFSWKQHISLSSKGIKQKTCLPQVRQLKSCYLSVAKMLQNTVETASTSTELYQSRIKKVNHLSDSFLTTKIQGKEADPP